MDAERVDSPLSLRQQSCSTELPPLIFNLRSKHATIVMACRTSVVGICEHVATEPRLGVGTLSCVDAVGKIEYTSPQANPATVACKGHRLWLSQRT
jgi:hypothetical protein